jgi:hypothetical protein
MLNRLQPAIGCAKVRLMRWLQTLAEMCQIAIMMGKVKPDIEGTQLSRPAAELVRLGLHKNRTRTPAPPQTFQTQGWAITTDAGIRTVKFDLGATPLTQPKNGSLATFVPSTYQDSQLQLPQHNAAASPTRAVASWSNRLPRRTHRIGSVLVEWSFALESSTNPARSPRVQIEFARTWQRAMPRQSTNQRLQPL